jgi:hypothetical protein
MLSILTWFAIHGLLLAGGAAVVVALKPRR